MERRDLLKLICCAVLLTATTLSTALAGDLPRIGFLGNSTAKLEAHLIGPFREGLRDLGYLEGKNIHIEYQWAQGDYSRFPKLIDELLARNVKVIITAGTPATLAVKKATRTVPLVMVAVGNPVGNGIVPSLQRPGGNITGLTSISTEMDGKRLALLKEILPDLKHVAVLWNSKSPLQVLAEKKVQKAASVLDIKVLSLGVSTKEGIDEAFAVMKESRPEALLVLADRLFLHHRVEIMKFAVQNRLPGVHAYRELVEAGGLMSYGPDYADMHRRAAYFVDRILKGANPAVLPVERPARFHMVINMTAAKELGLTIPETIMLRATELIE